MENQGKLIAISVIVASLIIGGFIYMTRVSEQKSIEKMRMIEIEQQKIIEERRAEKERLGDIFNKEIKCQDLLKDLKKRWNNIVGIYYSEYRNTCIVKYKINGKIEEAAIEHMQDQ